MYAEWVKHMQVWLEDMSNFPQFTILFFVTFVDYIVNYL